MNGGRLQVWSDQPSGLRITHSRLLDAEELADPQRLLRSIEQFVGSAIGSRNASTGAASMQFVPAPSMPPSALRLRPATEKQIAAIEAISARRKIPLRQLLEREFGLEHSRELSLTQASRLLNRLTNRQEQSPQETEALHGS